jgi:hypothetical protein
MAIKEFAKAIVGAAITGISTLTVGYEASNHFTTVGILSSVLSTLVSFNGIYFTNNADSKPTST